MANGKGISCRSRSSDSEERIIRGSPEVRENPPSSVAELKPKVDTAEPRESRPSCLCSSHRDLPASGGIIGKLLAVPLTPPNPADVETSMGVAY